MVYHKVVYLVQFYLFYIETAYVPNIDVNGSIVAYADDTCILFSDNTWDSVDNKASSELNRLIQN